MAPSRALYSFAASLYARQTIRAFSTYPRYYKIAQSQTKIISLSRRNSCQTSTARRFYSATNSSSESADTNGPPIPPDYLTEGELHIFKKVNDGLSPVSLQVQDISGGCGSMYALDIVSPKFAGMSVIKQHRLVNRILAEEIKTMHGVQLKTKAP
ncbi:bola-like protein [Patellaria atrata CBS 101060]|uniref:Bola-like protein n=1 Tax=Patellaria atrata CBS 101060 TaxID=1346257 RepID=A0A9P4VMP5_9PEZI|nr:bola-like protein [Patellaria atrata CBS 101060]